jgi:signal transduction histidine kinase
MQFKKLIGIASLTFGLGFAANGFASEEAATAEEVAEKVKAAAVALAEAGEAGLADFQGESKWAWKDTYVFVYDCDADKALAHPTLTDKPIMQIKDKAGKELFVELCAAGQQATGGWVSYMWPKPGAEEPSQKISYALSVEGTTYQVSAGIYSDDANVEELNAALAEQKSE